MKRIHLLLLLSLFALSATAQPLQNGAIWNRYFITGSLAVGKNLSSTVNPLSYANACAWLEVGQDHTNRGLILPRVDSTGAITYPIAGLIVYSNPDSALLVYTGNQWLSVGSGGGGSQGPTGPTGPTGPAGPAGQGVPTGGTVGQVLTKNSSTNYDASWATPSGGGASYSAGNGIAILGSVISTDTSRSSKKHTSTLFYTDSVAFATELNNYPTTLSFNSGTRDLTLGRNGLSSISANIPLGYDSTLMASVERLKDTAAAIRADMSTGGADQEVTLTYGATTTWDRSIGNYAILTLTGDAILDLTNAPTPSSGQIDVIQDGIGSHDLTLPGHLPLGGITWSTAAGSHDILGYTKNSKGLTWTTIESYGSFLITLSTPTLSLTAISSTEIDASWNNVANEASYKLERSPFGAGTWTQIGGTIPANTTSYNNTGLTASTHYDYRIKAVGDGVTYGDSGYGTDDETTSAGGCPTVCATATAFCDLDINSTPDFYHPTTCRIDAHSVGSGYWPAYCNLNLAASTNGACGAKYVGVNSGILGFTTNASLISGASAYEDIDAGIFMLSSGALYIVDASRTPKLNVVPGVTLTSNDIVVVYRTGSQFDVKIFSGGSFGSSVYTFTYSSSAAHFAALFLNTTDKFDNLQHQGLQ